MINLKLKTVSALLPETYNTAKKDITQMYKELNHLSQNDKQGVQAFQKDASKTMFKVFDSAVQESAKNPKKILNFLKEKKILQKVKKQNLENYMFSENLEDSDGEELSLLKKVIISAAIFLAVILIELILLKVIITLLKRLDISLENKSKISKFVLGIVVAPIVEEFSKSYANVKFGIGKFYTLFLAILESIGYIVRNQKLGLKTMVMARSVSVLMHYLHVVIYKHISKKKEDTFEAERSTFLISVLIHSIFNALALSPMLLSSKNYQKRKEQY